MTYSDWKSRVSTLAAKNGVSCRLTAFEAERAGLVSRVVHEDLLLTEAYKLAAKIGGLSTIAIAKAKDCVHRAYEMSLGEGLRYEQCVLLLPPTHLVVHFPFCQALQTTPMTGQAAQEGEHLLLPGHVLPGCQWGVCAAGVSSGQALAWRIRRRACELSWRSETRTSQTAKINSVTLAICRISASATVDVDRAEFLWSWPEVSDPVSNFH